MLADKAYDSNVFRSQVADIGAAAIPSNRTRKIIIPHDERRNRIESCFNRLKHLRRFATR